MDWPLLAKTVSTVPSLCLLCWLSNMWDPGGVFPGLEKLRGHPPQRRWQWIHPGASPELSSRLRLWVKCTLPAVSYAHCSLNCVTKDSEGPGVRAEQRHIAWRGWWGMMSIQHRRFSRTTRARQLNRSPVQMTINALSVSSLGSQKTSLQL